MFPSMFSSITFWRFLLKVFREFLLQHFQNGLLNLYNNCNWSLLTPAVSVFKKNYLRFLIPLVHINGIRQKLLIAEVLVFQPLLKLQIVQKCCYIYRTHLFWNSYYIEIFFWRYFLFIKNLTSTFKIRQKASLFIKFLFEIWNYINSIRKEWKGEGRFKRTKLKTYLCI